MFSIQMKNFPAGNVMATQRHSCTLLHIQASLLGLYKNTGLRNNHKFSFQKIVLHRNIKFWKLGTQANTDEAFRLSQCKKPYHRFRKLDVRELLLCTVLTEPGRH